MKFDIAIIGFGVIGTESLFKLTQKHYQKKELRIVVVEKYIKKIPGGIAYNKINSKFGFFNNPLRLSNIEFIKWIKKKENIENLVKFIKENKDYNLNTWLLNNRNFENKEIEKFDEIYLPRLFYSFFLEEKIIKILKNISKKNYYQILPRRTN